MKYDFTKSDFNIKAILLRSLRLTSLVSFFMQGPVILIRRSKNISSPIKVKGNEIIFYLSLVLLYMHFKYLQFIMLQVISTTSNL